MNILLAPNVYLPMASGVPVFTRQLASSLVRKGHGVVIVTRKLAQDQASFEVIDGIEVHRMPFVFPWSILWQESKEGVLQFCRRCPVDVQRLVRLMAKQQIELINIHSLSGTVFPYMLFAGLFADHQLGTTVKALFRDWWLKQQKRSQLQLINLLNLLEFIFPRRDELRLRYRLDSKKAASAVYPLPTGKGLFLCALRFPPWVYRVLRSRIYRLLKPWVPPQFSPRRIRSYLGAGRS